MNHFRRLRKHPNRENGLPGLEMSSLIDVSFLLLIYFLITSTLDPKEGDLISEMQPIQAGPGDGPAPIAIDISAEGIVSSGDEILDADISNRELPNLKQKLEWANRAWKLTNSADSYGVIVRADDQASGQRFIDVMNCLTETGISDVALEGFRE